MYYKQLLLAVGAIFIVILFFNTEVYSGWYQERLSTFADKFSEEAANLDYDARRDYRWQGPYDLAKFIKKTVGKDTNKWIIIPNAEYVKKADPKLHMPEPITLYYYTGLKSMYPDNKHIDSAKFAIFIINGNIKVVKIMDEKSLEMLKKHYAGQLSL